MKIAIIGARWLSSTVGRAWIKVSHHVLFFSRHLDKQQRVPAALGRFAFSGTIEEVAAFAGALLIAVPYRTLGGQALQLPLVGRIVMDACNPYAPDAATLICDVEAEGVALASARLPPSVRLMRALSAVYATVGEASVAGYGIRPGVPLASDDPTALQVAEILVRDAGCGPVAAGDLASGRRFQRGEAGFGAHLGAPALRGAFGLNQQPAGGHSRGKRRSWKSVFSGKAAWKCPPSVLAAWG